MKFLALWEFARKQDYIFKSNKLVEAIGASLIIKNVTENFKRYNLKDDNFLIRGGGKTLYAFDTLEEAKAFNKEFSVEILEKYDGLVLFMVITPYDENKDDIRDVIDKIYGLLEEKKLARKNSCHQVSFGIERPCQSTAMPASFKENDEYISKEIYVKRKFARENQDASFRELIPDNYELERTIENFIGNNDKNYVGVIHIDGNSMGKKFKELKNKVVKKNGESVKEFNERYVKTLRLFSEKVNEAYKEAFFFMTNEIEENKDKLKDITEIENGFFPIRPIILAGDDITYISNGFIAIETARIFMEFLSNEEIIIEGINLGKLTSCAGVSLVKKGYPFIKAYEMAEELCANAKKELIDENGEKRESSMIDFHVSQGEITCDINQIREKDYSLEGEKAILNMRPLLVGENYTWRNYDNFIETINNINKAIKEKSIGRNKIKSLRTEIKKGREATEHFFKFYNIKGGKFLRPVDGTLGDYTFNEKDGRCMYLDAIEIIDLFVKLEN